jgi:hypothetical protein
MRRGLFKLDSTLFILPEYHGAITQFVNTAISEVKNRLYPLLGNIETVYVESIPNTRSTMPSGEVVDSQPIGYRLEFPIELNDAIAGDSNSLLASIAGAAEQKGQLEMQSILEYVGRVTEGAGTSVDAKGKPVSRELILEVLSKQEINVDDDGYPEIASEVRHLFHSPSQECTCFTDDRSGGVVLVTSQNIREQLRHLPPPTEEELKAFEALIERKRKEQDDRRRYRQLS